MSEMKSLMATLMDAPLPDLVHIVARRLAEQDSIALVAYSDLQTLAAAAEIEMINRTMPEHAYADDY